MLPHELVFTPLDELTAEEMNQIVANLDALSDGSGMEPGSITAAKLDLSPETSESSSSVNSTSSSFADLNTAVTVDIGANGLALVSIYGYVANTSDGTATEISFRASGANTVASTNDRGVGFTRANGTAAEAGGTGATFMLTGLTPGSTTFTLQSRRKAGGGTAVVRQHAITVVPL